MRKLKSREDSKRDSLIKQCIREGIIKNINNEKEKFESVYKKYIEEKKDFPTVNRELLIKVMKHRLYFLIEESKKR